MTKILCVNDDLDILTLYRKILEPRGYDVLTTPTSQEAIDILNRQSINLVIQDFHRAEMDGYEFLKYLKLDENLLDIPVLAVTQGSKDQRGEKLKEIGLDVDRDLAGFIEMPFDMDEMLDQIQAILSQR